MTVMNETPPESPFHSLMLIARHITAKPYGITLFLIAAARIRFLRL